jgi:hypothetical protein
MILKNLQGYLCSLTFSLERQISNIFGIRYNGFLLLNSIYGLCASLHFYSSQSGPLHFSLSSPLLTEVRKYFYLFPSNHITQLISFLILTSATRTAILDTSLSS